MHIYLDRSYYKDEVVSFEFEVVQDYLYEMNAYEEGYTLYYFVPGWFDEITVDNLDVYWNMDKASSWSSGAVNENGYLHWNTSLQPGDRFELKIREEIENTKVTVEKVKEENHTEVLLGRKIDTDISKIKDVSGIVPQITFEAKVFGIDARETRSGYTIFTIIVYLYFCNVSISLAVGTF